MNWAFLKQFAEEELKKNDQITYAEIARRAKEQFPQLRDQLTDSVRRKISHMLSIEGFNDLEVLQEEFSKTEPVKESTEFAEDTGVLEAKGKGSVKTLEQLIRSAKIDVSIWDIERHVVNKWDVTTAEGRTFTNWQVKAWLKKNIEKEQVFNAEDTFRQLLSEHNPYKYKPNAYKVPYEKNLLEINIFDLHLGKLCWSEETNDNYDIKIASQRFQYALKTLLSRAAGTQFERILFPVGNDFFNSDNHLNTTTMGTRQDEDTRWQKTYKTGVQLLVEGIDYMRQFAPVDVIVVPGNHDFTKTFYLGETLHAWYRNDPNVNVNNSANPRKYYEYGNVLLGFTHGDKEKVGALHSLMAFEAKEAWARTIYKEFHLGHQHRKLAVKHTVKSDLLHEELGIVIRSMSSLAGTDAWHHTSGYIGPVKAAEAYLWNKEQGLIGNFNVNIKLTDN